MNNSRTARDYWVKRGLWHYRKHPYVGRRLPCRMFGGVWFNRVTRWQRIGLYFPGIEHGPLKTVQAVNDSGKAVSE